MRSKDEIRAYDRMRGRSEARKKKVRDHYRKMMQDPEWAAARREDKRRWRERNKIKRAAHVITGNAIRDGKLIKKPCETCGKQEVDAHHDDYSKPLEVRWLCKKHHLELHRRGP